MSRSPCEHERAHRGTVVLVEGGVGAPSVPACCRLLRASERLEPGRCQLRFGVVAERGGEVELLVSVEKRQEV